MRFFVRLPRRARGTAPRARDSRGFSLLELLIAIGVMAILVAFGVPAYQSYVNTHRLRGSAENLAAHIRLTRERAMSLGADQPLHFTENAFDADVHVHVGSAISYRWSFPRGIHYASGSTSAITLRKDGTTSTSGYVIVRDERGRRDTVSVLSSGIVLLR